ncbi:L-rhamnose mutarotase [Castellaniella caeni]|uniref:L-rhamnose mutarotase n=2 Tax=Castellaniella caeni TaxID=266123 RepID=UPI0008370243|nr:L-rhamnose mutarotase [Castellaniella caeni]
MIRRDVLMLDLRDDPLLIEQYEAHHRAVWPEVRAHLERQGVLDMEIYRLGTRLCMVMEVDEQKFDAARMRQAEQEDPSLQAWERLMWTFQQPTPWTPDGCKWVPARCIFRLSSGADAV